MTQIDLDELTDAEKQAVVNTSAFQKALKYRRLAQGIEVLKDNDAIYGQLVATITSRHSQVRSQSSTEEVLDLLVEEVTAYTEDLSAEDEEGTSIEDLLGDEDDG